MEQRSIDVGRMKPAAEEQDAELAGRNQGVRKKPLLKAAYWDGRRVILSFEYFAPVTSILKDRRFEGGFFKPRRAWVYPISKVRPLFRALRYAIGDMGGRVRVFFSESDALEKVEKAVASPNWRVIDRFLSVRVFPIMAGTGATAYAVTFEPDRWLSGHLKRAGLTWDADDRCWVWYGRGIKTVIDAIKAAGIRPEDVYIHRAMLSPEEAKSLIDDETFGIDVGKIGEVDDDLMVPDKYVKAKRRHEIIQVMDAPMEPPAFDERRFKEYALKATLKEFQVEGARHGVASSSALIADDMGLGKTRQGVVCGAATPGDVLVVSPANLKEGWRREILSVDDRERVNVIENGRSRIDGDHGWVVANYEQLGSITEYVKSNPGRFGKIIFDEAHSMKELEALRSKYGFALAEEIGNVLLLTGTPILNRERELYSLLKLAGHPLGRVDREKFELEFSGSAPLRKELGERLCSWIIRRMKADVLEHFPNKIRDVLRFDLDPEAQKAYDELYNSEAYTNALPKLNDMRKLVERATAKWLARKVAGSISEDASNKWLLFAEYRETTHFLQELLEAQGISSVAVNGANSMRERTAAMDAFQDEGSGLQVFASTTRAAGVGFTLTAANKEGFTMVPWTPGMQDQAEDRAYRMSQTRDVEICIPLARGTIAEDLYRCVDSKRAKSEDVMSSSQRVRELMQQSEGKDEEAIKQEVMEEVAQSVWKRPGPTGSPGIAASAVGV